MGPKKQRLKPIIERLAAEHADATIALSFASPLELLISVMLSAQTTDVNVNRVTEKLFQKYRRPEDYLAVPQEELERDIFATGFYRQKAKSLRGTMRMLLEEFDGRRTCVSTTMPCGLPSSDETTFAVLRATPGSRNSSGTVRGTLPSNSSSSTRIAPRIDFAFCR